MILQCHVSLSDDHKYIQSSGVECKGSSSVNSDMPPLKLRVLFLPHDSLEDIEPETESYALEVIGEEVQEMVHKNACLQDINEKLLSKAIDYLYQNKESRMYQMCLKSRHGTANLCVEKTRKRRSKASRSRIWDKRVIQQRNLFNIAGWKEVAKDLLKLWVVRSSDKMEGLI